MSELRISHFTGDGHAVIEGTEVARAADLDDILDSSGNELLEFDLVASAVNYVRLTNAATGNNPILSAQGESDTGLEFHTADAEEMLILEAVAAGVNELTISNAATGNNPTIAATGEADTGITFNNDQAEEILILNSIATSVNEFTIASAATGDGPQLEATGDDTNINIELIPKGTGYVDIQGGVQFEAQQVTPNNDSGAASTIEDGTVLVDVQAVTNDANDWIVLPSLASVPVGHTITICNNAGTNFELRTPASSNEKVNNTDCDGTQELLMTDTETVVITKVSDTDGWTAYSRPLAGGVTAAAVTPD